MKKKNRIIESSNLTKNYSNESKENPSENNPPVTDDKPRKDSLNKSKNIPSDDDFLDTNARFQRLWLGCDKLYVFHNPNIKRSVWYRVNLFL